MRVPSLKISVITVCFNMEKYIEATILSILNQGYESLEYIIVDGGSTDGTLEIVNKYRDKISLVVSEKDEGMYDALMKGISLSTGDVISWLNADDVYFPWTLSTVNRVFSTFEDVDWVCGLPSFMNADGTLTKIYSKPSCKIRQLIEKGWYREELLGYLQQESMFWRRDLYFSSGGLRGNFKLAGDFDLWVRFAKRAELTTLELPLAAFRKRSDSLSSANAQKYKNEIELSVGRPNLFYRLGFKLTRSLVVRHVLRLIVFGRSRLVSFSIVNGRFVSRRVLLSSASNTISSLVNEFSC